VVYVVCVRERERARKSEGERKGKRRLGWMRWRAMVMFIRRCERVRE